VIELAINPKPIEKSKNYDDYQMSIASKKKVEKFDDSLDDSKADQK
jgi:hypothetical protein